MSLNNFDAPVALGASGLLTKIKVYGLRFRCNRFPTYSDSQHDLRREGVIETSRDRVWGRVRLIGH